MLWARKYAGFIGEYEEKLPGYIKKYYESWENGDKSPTWDQLRKVSKKYNVPTAFFFMDTIPTFDDLPELINYRAFNGDDYKNKSPDLIKEIRNSENRRENYLDLMFELDEEVPYFEKVESSSDKLYIANYIRKKLDINLVEQKKWIKKNNSLDKTL